MTAEVESRRFRTWETASTTGSVVVWWLLVRYLVNRYIRVWYVYMVVILGVFGALLGVFLLNVVAGEEQQIFGVRPDLIQEGPLAFIGIGMALFALLVTAPSIAEDVRFNAHLFYFSKPVRTWDYMLGKTAFNFFGLALVGIIPALILAGTVLSIGPWDESAILELLIEDGATPAEARAQMDEMRSDRVDTWADAWYLATMPLLATLSLSVGLVGLTMAFSAFTRRAWHAAVGVVIFIVGWSVLGGIASETIESAEWRLYFPAGWMDAVTFLPISYRFRPYCPPEDGGRYCDYLNEEFAHAASTIWLSHLFLVLIGVIGMMVTWARVKRLQGSA